MTVLAGTTLYDLSKLLEDQGYALPILPSISDQTVAGAVATGESYYKWKGFAAYIHLVVIM